MVSGSISLSGKICDLRSIRGGHEISETHRRFFNSTRRVFIKTEEENREETPQSIVRKLPRHQGIPQINCLGSSILSSDNRGRTFPNLDDSSHTSTTVSCFPRVHSLLSNSANFHSFDRAPPKFGDHDEFDVQQRTR